MTDEHPHTASDFDHVLGRWTEPRWAPYPVSLEAIRRFVQAAMISDEIYGKDDPEIVARYGGIVAPPLFPLSVFVRPLGTPDPLDRFREDPDWDAAGGTDPYALPPIETPLERSMNGGTKARPIRLARVGDLVSCRARYLDVTPRTGRSGPLLLVRVDARYSDQEGNELLQVERTLIRR